jgi:hypothetical protein
VAERIIDRDDHHRHMTLLKSQSLLSSISILGTRRGAGPRDCAGQPARWSYQETRWSPGHAGIRSARRCGENAKSGRDAGGAYSSLGGEYGSGLSLPTLSLSCSPYPNWPRLYVTLLIWVKASRDALAHQADGHRLSASRETVLSFRSTDHIR